jgi:cephalosporin hydroxylase
MYNERTFKKDLKDFLKDFMSEEDLEQVQDIEVTKNSVDFPEDFLHLIELMNAQDIKFYKWLKAYGHTIIPATPSERTEHTGHFNHLGRYLMQNPKVFKTMGEFIVEEDFNTIIEIGSANGGLAMFLGEMMDNIAGNVISYDINKVSYGNNNLDLLNVDFRIKSVFEKDTQQEIENIIKTGGKCLVLCDGGNKKKEFNWLSKHIKQGDFIMAHDYASDEEQAKLNKLNKVWDWAEIQDKDVTDSMKYVEKSPKYYKDFSEVAWLCCTKVIENEQ